jgi:hypothetical protein
MEGVDAVSSKNDFSREGFGFAPREDGVLKVRLFFVDSFPMKT